MKHYLNAGMDLNTTVLYTHAFESTQIMNWARNK